MSARAFAHPTRDLLTHGLVPSAVGHALVLVLLATAGGRQALGTRYYEIDLEPVTQRAPAPAAPTDSSEPVAQHPVAGVGGEREAIPLDSGETRARIGRASAGPAGFVPPAARAGSVLTAPEGPGATDDAIDFSMVQGKSERYAGGVTTEHGTSAAPVYDPRARDRGVAGVVGAKGTGTKGPSSAAPAAAPVREPGPDQSRAPLPLSKAWSCPFPAEADSAKVNFARARIVVTVGSDGRARSAVVLVDPGNGFGRAAQRCALSQRYEVGLDAAGAPRLATTAPITVTFTR